VSGVKSGTFNCMHGGAIVSTAISIPYHIAQVAVKLPGAEAD